MREYQMFQISVRGSEHFDNQALSEECSQVFEDKDVKIAVVASGRNGSPYFRSHLGAKFAAETAVEMARIFAQTIEKVNLVFDASEEENVLRQLEGSIIVGWQERVREHLERSPIKGEEIDAIGDDPSLERYKSAYRSGRNLEYAYSSSITLAIWTDRFFLALRNGNGSCVLINKAGFEEPVPWNEKCVGQFCTSFSDRTAIEEFRHFFREEGPDGVWLSTKGVEKSFKDKESFWNYCRSTAERLKQPFEDSRDELEEELLNLSRKGSREDMTIALIWAKPKASHEKKVRIVSEQKTDGGNRKTAAKSSGSRILLFLVGLAVLIAAWKLFGGRADTAERTETTAAEETTVLAETAAEETESETETEISAETSMEDYIEEETEAATEAPTTAAPTEAPTTAVPTQAPTTAAPTQPPTTAAPTQPPTTAAPTQAPTTAAPTQPPTTAAPTEPPTQGSPPTLPGPSIIW